jgi:hypothetical protein
VCAIADGLFFFWSTAFLSHFYIGRSPFLSTGVGLESYGTVQGTAFSQCACTRAQDVGLVSRLRAVTVLRSLCGGGGVCSLLIEQTTVLTIRVL